MTSQRSFRKNTPIWLLLFPLLIWSGNTKGDDATDSTVRDSGVVELTGKRLIQFDLSVEVIDKKDPSAAKRSANLVKEDFIVRINFEELSPDQFEIDSRCPDPTLDTLTPGPAAEAITHNTDASQLSALPLARGYTTLYVDYWGLSTVGRIHTHAMIRQMVPRLIANGYLVRLAAQTRKLEIVADWTSDEKEVLDSLPPLNHQHILGAEPPSFQKVRELLVANQIDEAIEMADQVNLAKQLTLGRYPNDLAELAVDMYELPSPKAVVYFSDRQMETRSEAVNKAVSSGVRFYPIWAEGIAVPTRGAFTAFDPAFETGRSHRSLARRTGGEAGYGSDKKSASKKILEFIESDFKCVYVLSAEVDETDFEYFLKPRVQLRGDLKKVLRVDTAAPKMLLQAKSVLQVAETETAFSSAAKKDLWPANVHVRPIGIVDSKVRAEIQFSLETERMNDPVQSSFSPIWDLGITYFGKRRVWNFNQRVEEESPNRIVYEKEGAFSPGKRYDIVGVGREEYTSTTARGQATVSFETPKKNAFGFVGPLMLRQKKPGIYVSSGPPKARKGFVASSYAMVATNFETELSSLLCRGNKHHRDIIIEPQIQLGLNRPVVGRPMTMSKGSLCEIIGNRGADENVTFPWHGKPYEVTYTLRATDGKEVSQVSRRFWVIGPREDRFDTDETSIKDANPFSANHLPDSQ